MARVEVLFERIEAGAALRRIIEKGGSVHECEVALGGMPLSSNSVDDENWTFVRRAAACDNVAVLEWLVQTMGCDVNLVNQAGFEAPLHTAARKGRLNAVRCLVSSLGAVVDVKNGMGWTPLYVALLLGVDAVARFLLLAGASVAMLKPDLDVPAFVGNVQTAMRRCSQSALIVCGMRRCGSSVIASNGKDAMQLVGRAVWRTRSNRIWEPKEKISLPPCECCMKSEAEPGHHLCSICVLGGV